MKLLDLCCGFGGWSIGFHRAGFDCTGVDVVDIGYPYDLVLEDVRDYHAPGAFDVVVASPPCREFSTMFFLLKSTQGLRQDPAKGLELVKACIRIIGEVRPAFWVIENVRGAIPYFRSLLGEPAVRHPPWYLWGQFPPFLLGQSNLALKTHKGKDGRLNSETKFDPLQSWKRARIPLPLSVALADACRVSLERYPKMD